MNKKLLLQDIVIFLTAAVIFIIPIKFAGLVGLPEIAPMFPRNPIALVIITWPPLMFALVAAVLLVVTVIIMPPNLNKNRKIWIGAGLWLLTYGVSFLGWINASTYIFPYIEMVNLSGSMCFMLVIALILSARPDAKKILATALVIGLFVTLVLGVDQFINGIKNTMEFIEKREAVTGVELAGDFKVKVADVRLFSTFASSNSLSGFILLTFPLAFALIYKFAGRIEPSKISRPLFIGIFTLLTAFVFAYTRSRAAFLSLIFMVGICIVLFPVNKKLKIATCILIPLAIIAGAIAISMTERSFASMRVRIDYILRSAEMLAAHPFAGTGWGDFFHDYMKIKTYPTSEAPHMPHNIVMSFASQTGAAGGLAVIAAIMWPLLVLWKQMRNKPLLKEILTVNGAIFCGLLAFFIHGMFEVHLQVPANMAIALMLSILALTPDTKIDAEKKCTPPSFNKLIMVILTLAFITGAGFTLKHGYRLIRYQEAFERLGDLCDRRTKSPEEYMNISPDKVSRALNECVQIIPQSPFPWFTAGDFMLGHNRQYQAEQMYNKALALSPERASLHIRLYHLNKMRGEDLKARQHLMTALKMFPLHEKYIRLNKIEHSQ